MIQWMKENKIKAVIGVIALIVIVYSVAVITTAASYSVYAGDDFSHANGIGAFHVGFFAYLKASLKYSKYMWETWQGTYFAMFIQAFLSPINNFGYPQLKAVMILNSLLLFASVAVFLFVLSSFFKENRKFIGLVLTALMIYALTAYNTYEEIYYWFSGSTSYSFPLSFGLLGFSCFLLFNKKKKAGWAVLSALLGLCAAGGSLTVAGLSCYLMLLLTYYFVRERQQVKGNLIVFVIWVIGAGINAIAPGNYTRHSVMDTSGVHPLSAAHTALLDVETRLDALVNTSSMMVLLLLLVILGFVMKEQMTVNEKRYRICTVAALLMPVVTAFPVALGYSSKDLPIRCEFLIDVAILFALGNLAFAIGGQLHNLELAKMPRTVIAILIGMILLSATSNGFNSHSIKTRQVREELAMGQYQTYYTACRNILEALATFEPGTDLVLPNETMPEKIDNFYLFSISADPTSWVNEHIASYYGLGSIRLDHEEEEE